MPYSFLPDTSVIFNRKIISLINDGTLLAFQPKILPQPPEQKKLTIYLSRVMLAEIENQANRTKSQENMGLVTLQDLLDLAKQEKIDLKRIGERPTLEQIKLNPGGELDALIRKDAIEANAILITADDVQATMAKIEGLEVLFTLQYSRYSPDKYRNGAAENSLTNSQLNNEINDSRAALEKNYEEEKIENTDNLNEYVEAPFKITALTDPLARIEHYFDEHTMSVHLTGHCMPMAKRGKPGNWQLETIGEEPLDPKEIAEFGEDLITYAKHDENSFIEKQLTGVAVIQLQNYRIVITQPPFSNTVELTAVRPIVTLSLEDYHLSPKVLERLTYAEGILVAGSPGAGKSTFISALTEFYHQQRKVIKTLESVRDLNVPPEVAQYAPLEGSLEKTADILLLVRPDFTIFDEVRTESDFKIFGDMRLAGVGLVGVVHASEAIDAVQRFIRKIELGVIPSVIDTIIYIDQGQVAEVLSLEITVKKPTGFADRDLARPVIEVRDFITNSLLYEIYAFGSDVIVAPVGQARKRSKQRQKRKQKAAFKRIKEAGYNIINDNQNSFEKKNSKKQNQDRIMNRNYQSNGFDIDMVVDMDADMDVGMDYSESDFGIPVSVYRKNKGYVIVVGRKYRNKYMNFYSDGQHLFAATLNKNGEMQVKIKSPVYGKLRKALKQGEEITASFN